MGLYIEEPAEQEPVTLEQAKHHLRVEFDDDDELIEGLILAARMKVETDTRRQLEIATWTKTLDAFPCGRVIELPLPPLVEDSVSISYVDTDGEPATFSDEKYHVDIYSEPGRIVLNSDATWPSTASVANAVSITFDAGYETVPFNLRQAILLLVGSWYENRADVVTGTIATRIPNAYDALIAPANYGFYA